MARNVTDEIRQEIAANKVMIYMKGTPSFPMCGFSASAIEILEESGYPFAHVNILEDQEKREAVKAFSNWPTIPQVYIGGKFVGGSDILRELHASGDLQRLLKETFDGAAAS